MARPPRRQAQIPPRRLILDSGAVIAWSRDAAIYRVRNAVDVFPTEEPTARLAGALRAQTRGTSTVDALVAAEAVTAGADVLTTDAGDVRALLVRRPDVRVIAL